MSGSDVIYPAKPFDNEDPTIKRIIELKEVGSKHWLVELLKACGPMLNGALTEKFEDVLNKQDIEDVISEFVRGKCEQPDNFDPTRGSLIGFCFRKMCWIANDIATKKLLLIDPSSENWADIDDCGDRTRSPVQNKRISTLREAIDTLSPREQEVILADIRAGGTAISGKLAIELETTPNAIDVTRCHAREKIRNFFKARNYNIETLEKIV